MSDFADMLARAADSIDPPDHPTGDLAGVFDEPPVSLTVFVQDAAYLGNPPLSFMQYDAVRHVERIFYDGWFSQPDGNRISLPERDTYKQLADEFESGKQAGRLHVGTHAVWREEKYWSEQIRMTNFATLQWGKGSGKDHICRVASMRIAYLLMCLTNPQRYYRMPAQDTIHLLNVASSSGQAQQAFFLPVVRAVKRGWFKDRCTPRQNVISFAKNVESVSGHSDAESQEGLNLLLGIADEIDAFKSLKEMMFRRASSGREPTKSAEGILNMMRSSGATRFPETFKQVRISYPRYLGSKIQLLTDEARADVVANGFESRHYVSGPLATWEVNPRVPGREAFAGDYKEDPVMARAKYECKPARALNPYFRNHVALDACMKPRAQLPLEITYRLEESTGRSVWIPEYRFAPDFYPIRGARYAMHGDLAVSGDRAGIAMSHVANYSEHFLTAEDEDGATYDVRETRPHVKVDFVVAFTSDIGENPPREIQIRWARQLAFELIRRGFNIKRFTFDGFQSQDSMQILQSKGIESKRVSTDVSEDGWRTLRDLAYDGRITIPRPAILDETNPPPFLLRDELLGLTQLPNGRVDHPSDGSKDLADALACSVLGAIDIGGAEEDPGARTSFTRPDFQTGSIFDLPYGVRRNGFWERSGLGDFHELTGG